MIVGIDLGTTNSLVAVWRQGQAELIRNALGQTLTPSCVSLDEDGSVLVGQPALERLATHPERSAALFKRYMGSDRSTRLGGRLFRPEELSALVLRALKADAEAALGEAVTEAVITVPAYFSDAQRKATRTAGELAGLKVERLLNEPTAAALAHGLHLREAERRFLVFDLGGGTFDISILDLFEGVMEVRASAGDNRLGGEDMVQALVDQFFTRLGLPSSLRSQPVFMQRLARQAEAAKRALSQQPSAWMRVSAGPVQHELEVDEALLEAAIAPLLQRLRAPVERALRDAGLRASELDEVVLAGGATRMPLVRRLVTTLFGRFPAVALNPDEVVALGAAVQAGLKARDAALDDVVMTDVAPYSLGVAVSVPLGADSRADGHFAPIIERNTTVPVSREERFFPVEASQREVLLEIYQGESRLVRDNVHLGQLTVPLPRAGQAQAPTPVDVRFTYDVNGLLEVQATVGASGEVVRCTIEGNPGLMTPAEIAERLRTLAALKIHPRDQLPNRSLMARAERLHELLLGPARAQLAQHILVFEQLMASQDERQIAPGRQALADLLEAVERDSFMDGAPV